jgi:hypothetical protein
MPDAESGERIRRRTPSGSAKAAAIEVRITDGSRLSLTRQSAKSTAEQWRLWWPDSDICIPLGQLASKRRNQKTTIKRLKRLELLNLTFENALAPAGTQMSNSLHEPVPT